MSRQKSDQLVDLNLKSRHVPSHCVQLLWEHLDLYEWRVAMVTNHKLLRRQYKAVTIDRRHLGMRNTAPGVTLSTAGYGWVRLGTAD